MMRLGLVVRGDRSRADEVAASVSEIALQRRMEVVSVDETELAEQAKAAGLHRCDVIMAIGGDGTVLRAAHHAIGMDVPVVGVNVGRVGFLADAEPEDLDAALGRLAAGDWEVSSRMTIRAVLSDGRDATGLNDVVVEKTTSQRLVSLEVTVDGDRFLTYRADGLVFAAPLGSTAYNLSAGGPIVDPAIDALVVTPVAPYSLFSQALVLPPTVVIECRVVHDRPAGVNVDGLELGVVEPGDTVTIHRGEHRVRFIDLDRQPYLQRVKRKLRLYEGLDGGAF